MLSKLFPTMLDYLGTFGLARESQVVTKIEIPGRTEPGGVSVSTSFCFSTDSVNADVIILKLPTEGVTRVMEIARTPDNGETSFRAHFTAAPLNHSGTLGEEPSQVPNKSTLKVAKS